MSIGWRQIVYDPWTTWDWENIDFGGDSVRAEQEIQSIGDWDEQYISRQCVDKIVEQIVE